MRRLDGILANQSDARILSGFSLLVIQERKRKSDLLAYLNEVDVRKLYAQEGYSSLFRFLTEKHFFSESSALKRIQAARLARKFPFLYGDIKDGKYSLSALSRLAPFVSAANADRLFRKSERKSTREVEAMLAAEFPKADVADRLSKTVSPLSENRVKIQFSGPKELVEDIERLRDLLSHRYPQGKLADVVGLAVKALIRELEKPGRAPKTHAAGNTKSKMATKIAAKSLKRSRYIPRGIRRDLGVRDTHRCQHLRPDGTLCGETRFLEVDHIQPYALGGGNGRENLRLLCWAHNQLRAEAQFGRRSRQVPAVCVEGRTSAKLDSRTRPVVSSSP